MDKSKLPTTDIGKLVHITEECAEVQKAISKFIRFGPLEYNPKDPDKTPNVIALVREIQDLQSALLRVEPYLISFLEKVK